MRFGLAVSYVFLLLCTGVVNPVWAKEKAATTTALPAKSPSAASAPVKAPLLIDINSDGVGKLKTLPGIGDDEAARIVAGRPYKTKAELVTKNVLSQGTFLSIRRSVTVERVPKSRSNAKNVKNSKP